MSNKLTIHHHALHAQFLIVLVVDAEFQDMRAYYVVVPGKGHAVEARAMWREHGLKASERDARHFMGATLEHYEKLGYHYAR